MQDHKTFIAIGFGLILATSAAIASAIWHLRQDALTDAKRNVANIAKILSQQTSHSSQAIELVLDDLIREVKRRQLDVTEERYSSGMNKKEVYNYLIERLSRLPQADVATFTDKSGKVLSITRGWPTPNVNLSDRDYFAHFSKAASPELFISEPVQNKVTNTWTVYFSKRVESPEGEFLGVVLIGVRPEFFIPAFDVISSIAGQSMLLLRRDGTILLRYPDIVNRAGIKMAEDSVWHDLVRKGGGFYRSEGVFNDGARLVDAQPIPGYNLVVNVAMQEAKALSTWRSRAYIIAVSAVASELAFLILLRALYRLFVRQKKSESDLLSQSQELIKSNSLLESSLSDYTFLAHHDPLCNLYNRSYFIEQLSVSLADSTKAYSAVLLIDLDLFKEVNDTFGHMAGDMVLRDVGLRLSAVLQQSDVVARLGGDEFGILLSAEETGRDISQVAEVVSSFVRRPYSYETNVLRIGVSIGVALLDHKATSVERVMKSADLALYQAKSDGRNCIRFFEDAFETAYRLKRELAADINRAMEQREIKLVYQPIVRAMDFMVEGMEALLRWNHPDRGFISPLLVVQIAEETGLIHSLGEYVLRQSLDAACGWHPTIGLSVNVSALQLNNEAFPAMVRDVLGQSGLDPERVTLEITETALIEDYQQAKRNLIQLKEIGVKVALDDFGTGYSSLSYLHSMSFQKIKIDKTFVDRLESSSAAAIVESVVRIAQSVQSTTTAEGVETLKQMFLLQNAGVTSFQGYLFGKPQPQDAWDLQDKMFLIPEGALPERILERTA